MGKNNQSQRQAFLLQTAPGAAPTPCTSHCHQCSCSVASTHRALNSWKQKRSDHSQLMEIPLLSHFDGCSWGPLTVSTDSHWAAMPTSSYGNLPISTLLNQRTELCSRIEKLCRIRPQLLSVEFMYSFHFTRKSQWWMMTCDPKVKEWVSVMGSEVCSSLLKPNQGCKFSTIESMFAKYAEIIWWKEELPISPSIMFLLSPSVLHSPCLEQLGPSSRRINIFLSFAY